MSQSSFLEDVVCWTNEECQQRMEEAVPKLVSFFNDAENYHGEIGILKILCQCFLPCMELTDLERCIFKEIYAKTCQSYDRILEDVKSVVGNGDDLQVKDNLEGLFELMLDILDCVEGSVKYCQGGENSLDLSQIHSLSPLTFHLLRATFNHCKDSGEIYRDLITSLSEPLSVLFRKAYSLQMSFLNLLDKLSVGFDCSEEDVQDLTAVCEGLYRISQLVTSFDIKIAVTLWKAISRYVTQHKFLLRERLDLCGMVVYLCSEIQRGYSYLFTMIPHLDETGQPTGSQGDNKSFLKSAKILGFQMKVLVMLLKEYQGYLADCERPVYILLLQLYKMQLPCLSAPRLLKEHQEEIERQLLNATEPILTQLLDSDRFIILLSVDDTEGSEDTALPHLLLQIIVLGLLPTTTDETQKKWLFHVPPKYREDEDRRGIISAVFNSCEKCHVELLVGGSLPGVMCSGKPQRFVSLYEHVCTRLCGFVGTISADQFPTVENCLLENVISTDPICSRLASDVWCFLNRYGSADLCLSHIKLFCSIVRQSAMSHVSEYRALISLIGRLIKFMAPEHQEKLFTVCPVEENLVVWSYLPLTELSSTMQAGFVNTLSTTCVHPMEKWIDAKPKKLSLLAHLNCCLDVLCNIFKSFGAQEDGPLGQCLPELLENYIKLWSCLPANRCVSSRASSLGDRSLCLIVECGGHLAQHFNNTVLLQMIRIIIKLLNETPSVEFKLSVCHFLQRCSFLKIAPTSEQTQILMCFADCFRSLLSEENCLVQHAVCQAVALFASESIHTTVLEESLHNQTGLQMTLSAYVQKRVNRVPQVEKLVQLKSQKEALDRFKELTVEDRAKQKTVHEVHVPQSLGTRTETENDQPTDLLDSISEEPAAKKPRLGSEGCQVESDLENDHKDLLEKTQVIVAQWIEVLQSQTLSPSIRKSLQQSNNDLSTALASQKENG